MRRTVGLRAVLVTFGLVVLGVLAGCSDDDGGDGGATGDGAGSAAASTSTTTADPDGEGAGDDPDTGGPTLRILVSNDDGIEHPGMDLMVRRLSELPDVEIAVVAPAVNRSGSGRQTTPGGAAHSPGRTASGFEGTAVDGYPADSIAVALDQLGLRPHVVVSGVNDAHNIGPIAQVSGTLGVVRTAVERGVPGVAGSAGLEYDEGEFSVAVDLVAGWITQHRAELVAGTLRMDAAVSFNVPTCEPEQMGDVVEVPLAVAFPTGANPFESRCDLSGPPPTDDYEALAAGYPAMTMVPVDLG